MALGPSLYRSPEPGVTDFSPTRDTLVGFIKDSIPNIPVPLHYCFQLIQGWVLAEKEILPFEHIRGLLALDPRPRPRGVRLVLQPRRCDAARTLAGGHSLALRPCKDVPRIVSTYKRRTILMIWNSPCRRLFKPCDNMIRTRWFGVWVFWRLDALFCVCRTFRL